VFYSRTIPFACTCQSCGKYQNGQSRPAENGAIPVIFTVFNANPARKRLKNTQGNLLSSPELRVLRNTALEMPG